MKKNISYIYLALSCLLLAGAGQVSLHAQTQESSNVLSNAINSAVKYGPAVAALGSALFTPQQTQAQGGGLWNFLTGGGQKTEPVQPQSNQTVASILPMLFGQPEQHQKAQTHAQTTLPKFFQQMADQPQAQELSDDQMRSLFNQSHQMTEQLFKSMGLPVPQLTDEQKDQMFQFSKQIFEQNKDLFKPANASSENNGNNFLQNLLGATSN